MTVWDDLQPRLQRILARYAPELRSFLLGCQHGRTVWVPKRGSSLKARDKEIRAAAADMLRQPSRPSRGFVISALADAYGLHFRHVQRILGDRRRG